MPLDGTDGILFMKWNIWFILIIIIGDGIVIAMDFFVDIKLSIYEIFFLVCSTHLVSSIFAGSLGPLNHMAYSARSFSHRQSASWRSQFS